MKILLKKLLLVGTILGGISSTFVGAENLAEKSPEDYEFSAVLGNYILPDPVGKIEGNNISKRELNLFLSITEDVEINEVTDPFISLQILRGLGLQKHLAEASRARGLDQNIDYQKKLAFSKQQLLIEMLFEDMLMKDELNLDAVKAEYAASLEALKQNEYQASQILVETEAEAQAIIDAINRQETTLAKEAKIVNELPEDDEYTGSLGDWFTESMIDVDFGAALKTLSKGEMSSIPVKTDYGYHVIVLDDVREIEQPTFEALDAETRYQLAQPAFQKYIESVQETIKIELPEAK